MIPAGRTFLNRDAKAPQMNHDQVRTMPKDGLAPAAQAEQPEPTGQLTEIDGVEHYRIDDIGSMEPFLMSIVSSSDLWMFASSRGTLTAGRTDADHALLPYETDDRLHRMVGLSGPITILARQLDGRRELWHPFGPEQHTKGRRKLAKAVMGNRLVFEETNDDWGLRYRATWMPSPSFGWVRRIDVTNTSGSGAEVEILDGLLDVMPSGVPSGVEQLLSNLVDAYKRSETGRWDTAAIYTVESAISDRSEPTESLTATAVWSHGTGRFEIHLDERVREAMIAGRTWPTTSLLTGRRGAYLVRGRVSVEPNESVTWSLVTDTGLDHAQVLDRTALAGDARNMDMVERDIAAGSANLRSLLAEADGYQETGERMADAHHLSNVLFNSMRGGGFPNARLVTIAHFLDHVRRWNGDVFERNRDAISSIGETVDFERLRAVVSGTDDADLIRLMLEYLPLAFSRRHGDPSRPWNRFSIHVQGESGEEVLGYEGNWRDIFQNWEALLMSYPAVIPNAVAKFLNASTIDGHNPYRITQDGVDWEVPDPHDPWSNIGYWGDHQIVYLHRLITLWERFDPGGIGSWLDQRAFVYADVPYTIADYSELVRDPRNTITFDSERADRVEERVRKLGNDGRLVVDASDAIVRVGLIEKLLVPALAKLTNLVPGGGIWMNTQRPEWNDANNALAGFGLSMVTSYHLHGYISMLRRLVETHAPDIVQLSGSSAGWVTALADTLDRFSGRDCHLDDRSRREVVDALGEIGDRQRSATSKGFDAEPVSVARSDIDLLLAGSLELLEDTLRTGRRPDGLYDSYNLVSFPTETEVRVDRLGPMLEGQVAVLSSGFLDAQSSLELIESLYASDMYRADQDSFMLYPVRQLPSFLDRNSIPGNDPRLAPLLDELTGAAAILVGDRVGNLHFSPEMVNVAAVKTALEHSTLDTAQRTTVLEVYESVFGHHAYTGRSGSMYGYEGIGSIYWHMVGKLLVAVQETYWAAIDRRDPATVIEALADAYRRIRSGLGFRKDPATWGAIPTDCYSHTPAHAGAQQPGMTGQVKEGILTRFGELGMRIVDGRISLCPGLLRADELIPDEREDGSAVLSFCGVGVQIEFGEIDEIRIRKNGAWDPPTPGLKLDPETSAAIFSRNLVIDGLRFTMAKDRRNL